MCKLANNLFFHVYESIQRYNYSLLGLSLSPLPSFKGQVLLGLLLLGVVLYACGGIVMLEEFSLIAFHHFIEAFVL